MHPESNIPWLLFDFRNCVGHSERTLLTQRRLSVIICLFSSTRELSKEFMQAASSVGMKSHDYVFILPWLQAEAKDASPWLGADGQMVQSIKDTFGNAIIVRFFLWSDVRAHTRRLLLKSLCI